MRTTLSPLRGERGCLRRSLHSLCVSFEIQKFPRLLRHRVAEGAQALALRQDVARLRDKGRLVAVDPVPRRAFQHIARPALEALPPLRQDQGFRGFGAAVELGVHDQERQDDLPQLGIAGRHVVRQDAPGIGPYTRLVGMLTQSLQTQLRQGQVRQMLG